MTTATPNASLRPCLRKRARRAASEAELATAQGRRQAQQARERPRLDPVAKDGRGVRVAIREQEEVGVRLRGVAEAGRADVPEPFRHPSPDEPEEPGENGHEQQHVAERARDQERRKGEEEAEERHEASLWLGRGDLDVDPVRAGASGESRELLADEIDVRVHVRRVADVCRDEAVERARNAADDEGDEPGCDDGEVRRDAPE